MATNATTTAEEICGRVDLVGKVVRDGMTGVIKAWLSFMGLSPSVLAVNNCTGKWFLAPARRVNGPEKPAFGHIRLDRAVQPGW